MISHILHDQLRKLRVYLVQSEQWPIDDRLGYDLNDPEVRAELFRLRTVHWPLCPGNYCMDGSRSEQPDRVRDRFQLTEEFDISWGVARPHLLWITRIEGGHLDRGIPAISACGPLDYLDLEETLAIVRTLEAEFEAN